LFFLGPWPFTGTFTKTFAIHDCRLGHEGVRLMMEAFRGVQLIHLEYLALANNDITRIGLQALTDGIPLALLHLKKLKLSGNKHLFYEEDSTQRFAGRILLSDDMAIEGLRVWRSGHFGILIIKSCEQDNIKLRVLHISDSPHMRDQLVESLPKMKHLQELYYGRSLKPHGELARCDGTVLLVDPTIMAALHENTSLVKISDFYSLELTIYYSSPLLSEIKCCRMPMHSWCHSRPTGP
jgi:hypothetical protein